jgi:serine/threonine protein kinase
MNSKILRNTTVRSSGLQTIGNYVVNTNALLGQGSFSRIYLGTDKRTGNEVAVKVIDLNMINGKGLKKFLDHEIKINSMVDHPYVLWCY